MDFQDERYVRLYIRNTPDWMAWPWEARALFPLLLRAVDRAGVLELGKHGERALASVVGLPVEVVTVGLAALVDDGCVSRQENVLCVVRYIEAQECRQSDRVRQQESRAKRALVAKSEGGVVTKRDMKSQNVMVESRNVTAGDKTSHDVTPYRTVPCRDQELLSGFPDDPPASEPVNCETKPAKPTVDKRTETASQDAFDLLFGKDTGSIPESRPDPKAAIDAQVTEVLTYWRGVVGMDRASIEGPKAEHRRKRIKARLKEKFTVEQLRQVADGAAKDPFLMGTDPKSKPGGYRDVETVYRDAAQCERLIALSAGNIPKQVPVNSGNVQQQVRPRPPPVEQLPKLPEKTAESEAAMKAALAGLFGRRTQ